MRRRRANAARGWASVIAAKTRSSVNLRAGNLRSRARDCSRRRKNAFAERRRRHRKRERVRGRARIEALSESPLNASWDLNGRGGPLHARGP